MRAASNINKRIYLNGGCHRSAEPFEVFYCMNKKTKTELIYPFISDRFLEIWGILLQEKKWKGKSINALQMALNKLSNYSEQVAIIAIENTIAGNYQGIFPESVKITENPVLKTISAGQNSFNKLQKTNIDGIEKIGM
jgi:hypothetical protein